MDGSDGCVGKGCSKGVWEPGTPLLSSGTRATTRHPLGHISSSHLQPGYPYFNPGGGRRNPVSPQQLHHSSCSHLQLPPRVPDKGMHLASKPKLAFCVRVVLWSAAARFDKQHGAVCGKGHNSWNPLIKRGDLRSRPSHSAVQDISGSSGGRRRSSWIRDSRCLLPTGKGYARAAALRRVATVRCCILSMFLHM